MSHLGTRLLADRLADLDEGVNPVAALVPRNNDDTLLPGSVRVYDDTRDGWVGRGLVPQDDAGVDFPCIRVFTAGVDYDSGVPTVNPDGSRTIAGTLRVVAQLILRDSDDADVVAGGMYLLRAMRGVIVRLDDPASETARTSLGIQLRPATSIVQAKIEAPVGENITSPGALLISYPFIETVPLP